FFHLYLDYSYLHSFPTRRSSDLNEKFISFISFFLLLLNLSNASEVIDPNTLDQVEALANSEPTTVTLKHVFHHGSIEFPKLFRRDRKSTRLNSSHRTISYAVFCL